MLVSSGVLTPNNKSLALRILHLKPKVVNILAKTWFIKTNLQYSKTTLKLIKGNKRIGATLLAAISL